MSPDTKYIKSACYMANMSMAVVANLSPLLFVVFRSLYDISYSLLGLLVLINFCTQLAVDLLFSFFSSHFPIEKAVRITPLLTAVGLLIYALSPFLFPGAVYAGLVIGTVVFAASGGLAEVLISPVIAAISPENGDREMSKLHSVYAWSVVLCVTVSTLFLFLLGQQSWQWLVIIWIILPVISFFLFCKSRIPELKTPEKSDKETHPLKNKLVILFVLCIFFGGASENAMAQWSSSYLEKALSIPKVWGDLLGVALFAAMLGTGRTLYSKIGKNITTVLLAGAIGATACYTLVAVTPFPAVGLIACALTGLCVSMLWPGSLIVASDRLPEGGVVIFALMAAGGDLGGAVGPQLIGILTDTAIKTNFLSGMAAGMGLTQEQFGMKLGMFVAILFPLFAVLCFGIVKKLSCRKG